MNSDLLLVDNISKTFMDQDEPKVILQDVSLGVKEKDFICILGPSGCGKTTLLRCIAGFETYTGSISVEGKKVMHPGIDRIMVFQDFNQLFPWKTVEKNIQYPLKIQGLKNKSKLNELTREALEKVKLGDYAHFYPHQLSGGMKQRVAIAKALALRPKIILMDEPFAALDAITRRELQEELLRIAEEENSTFIFVTHNIQEAIVLGKRIIVMGKEGKVVFDEKNTLVRPITPASDGYGQLWRKLEETLHN